MSTFTPNYNLEKPEASDPFENFRQSYNNNMDEIDRNLGGGGGSGGHTIVDENGADMPAEGKLQFTGNVTVSDDSINGKTVVNVTGGGGSANIVELTQAEYDALPDSKLSDDVVYMIKDALSASDAELTHVNGIFVDPTNVLYNNDNISQNPFSYTATEDCYVKAYCRTNSTAQFEALIDSVQVGINYNTSANFELFVKKGQVFTLLTNGSVPGWGMRVEVYGIQQGSNVTIIPDYASACYSTTEREVGCWVDGKPAYQRTVEISNVSYDSNWHNVAHGIQNVESIVQIKGIMKTTSNYFYNCDVFRPSTTLGVVMEVTATNISYINSWIDNADKLYVTLVYTKTTDVAGSGNWTPLGKPTVHYSTDEQVIGTWLGKPLYQKTINIASTTIPSGGNVTFSLQSYGIQNAEKIINFNGTAMSGATTVPFNYLSYSDNVLYAVTLTVEGDTLLLGRSPGSAITLTDIYITIQYTKTAD